MFGREKFVAAVVAAIEDVLKRYSFHKDWRVEQLQREVDDLRTWNRKVRAKNSALRRDRRRLRELLDANNVPWRT